MIPINIIKYISGIIALAINDWLEFHITVLFFSYNLTVNHPPLIAILTDFGTVDPFTGIMKGVIARITPVAKVVDLTNNIPPGDVKRAAVNLWQSCPYFPLGTIFLCVVDPGVGTSRRAILMDSGGYIFIGPDNGIFTFVMAEDARIWELSNPDYALPVSSSTFHGRDIFAPAAAHVARGVSGSEFGPAIHEPVSLPLPRLEAPEPDILIGEILYADRFGNLLTGLGRFERDNDDLLVLDSWLSHLTKKILTARFRIDELIITLEDGSILTWVNAYAEIPPDECAFLLGSSGLIEIVSNRESAEQILDISSGDTVTLKRRGEPHG